MQEFKVGDLVDVNETNLKKEFFGTACVIEEIYGESNIAKIRNTLTGETLDIFLRCLDKSRWVEVNESPQEEPFELKEGMKFKIKGIDGFRTVDKVIGETVVNVEGGGWSSPFNDIDWKATREANVIFLSNEEIEALEIHYESAEEMFDKKSPEFKLEVGMRFKTLDIVELPPKYRNKILVAELTKVEGHIGVIDEGGFYYIKNKYIDWKNTEKSYSLETKTSIESITSEQIDKWNEVDSEKTYYVVYKEPSAKRHLSYEEALEEAKSKLLRSPNDKVCIMKCEAVVGSKIEVEVKEMI